MTLLGNFVRTREQGEKSMDWRSMNGRRSSSRAFSFLRRTLILASHASFAPFVPYERLIFFLSGHAIKISQQSHQCRLYSILGYLLLLSKTIITLLIFYILEMKKISMTNRIQRVAHRGGA